MITDPNLLHWVFQEIPAIEDVPNDAVIVVWGPLVGLMHPWCNGLGSSCCVDGCWSESRGDSRYDPETKSYILRDKGVNLVQHRTVRKPVWWAWVRLGTPNKAHPHPTWRQVHGPLIERDWE